MKEQKMNSKKTKDIERLMQRFFDGETTTEEEARLYRVFRRKRLPHSLKRIRPVMEAFGSMEARAPRRAMTASIVRRVLAGAAAAGTGSGNSRLFRLPRGTVARTTVRRQLYHRERTAHRRPQSDTRRHRADARRLETHREACRTKRDRPRGAGCARQHIRP